MNITVKEQPTDYHCGPTALQAIYSYYHVNKTIKEIANNLEDFGENGTSDVYLALDAQNNGFDVTLYTCNIKIFDPKWKNLTPEQLSDKLNTMAKKQIPAKLKKLIKAYIKFLDNDGVIVIMNDVRYTLKKVLSENYPIICGLNSTYLYGEHRANPNTGDYDQYSDDTVGHFIVASQGKVNNIIDIADPYGSKSSYKKQNYQITLTKLSECIMLGVLTNEGSFITLE